MDRKATEGKDSLLDGLWADARLVVLKYEDYGGEQVNLEDWNRYQSQIRLRVAWEILLCQRIQPRDV